MSDIMATPPSPVNYTGLQIQPDPIGSFLKGAQVAQTQAQTGLIGAQTQQVQQNAALQQLAVERQQDYHNAWQQFSQNPSPQAAVQMAMSYPELATNVTSAWNEYNEQQRQQKLDLVSPIYSSLLNGRPDIAENLVQQHIDAIQNTSGYESDPQMQQDLSGANRMLSLIQGDQQNGTNNARAYLGATMAAAMGPQDFMQHFGQGATMPSQVSAASYAPAQAAATVTQTNATAAELQANAASVRNDANMRVQDWIRAYNFPPLNPEQNDQLNSLAIGAATANNRANQFDNLTNALNNALSAGDWKSGITGSVAGKLQSVFGTQDPLSVVRNSVGAVTNTPEYGLLLASGNPDAKALSQGIPQNASAQYLKTMLQAASNLSHIQARMSDVSAQWMSVNGGSMGNATRDFSIGNVRVAAGTPFSAVMMKAIAPGSKFPSAYPAASGTAGLSNAAPSFNGNLSYLNKYTSGQ